MSLSRRGEIAGSRLSDAGQKIQKMRLAVIYPE